MGIFLTVFFLLVIRIQWDKWHGQKTPELKPTRSAAPVIRPARGG